MQINLVGLLAYLISTSKTSWTELLAVDHIDDDVLAQLYVRSMPLHHKKAIREVLRLMEDPDETRHVNDQLSDSTWDVLGGEVGILLGTRSDPLLLDGSVLQAWNDHVGSKRTPGV